MTNATRTRTQSTVFFIPKRKHKQAQMVFKYFPQRIAREQLSAPELGKSKCPQFKKFHKKMTPIIFSSSLKL